MPVKMVDPMNPPFDPARMVACIGHTLDQLPWSAVDYTSNSAYYRLFHRLSEKITELLDYGYTTFATLGQTGVSELFVEAAAQHRQYAHLEIVVISWINSRAPLLEKCRVDAMLSHANQVVTPALTGRRDKRRELAETCLLHCGVVLTSRVGSKLPHAVERVKESLPVLHTVDVDARTREDREAELEQQLNAIGPCLREHREHLGLSVAQAAELAGLSENHLAGLEKGRSIPGLRTMVRLAVVLEIDLNTLFPNKSKVG